MFLFNFFHLLLNKEAKVIAAFSISISYIEIYTHVGKGLPTYCIARFVGRQPFATDNFKIINCH